MLSPKNFGLAGGIIVGLKIFLATLFSVATGYAHDWLTLLGDYYPGYTVSGGGSIIGLLYGFIDGFITLYLIAWLYDKLSGYCVCCADKSCKTHMDKTDTVVTNDKPKEWK